MALDLDFLHRQTAGDLDLEREILTLFINQARQVMARMPGETEQAQADSAHLIKGAARSLGAFAAADAAALFEQSPATGRAAALSRFRAVVEETCCAIEAHLRAGAGL